MSSCLDVDQLAHHGRSCNLPVKNFRSDILGIISSISPVNIDLLNIKRSTGQRTESGVLSGRREIKTQDGEVAE
jgi:hypothetical protein